MIEKITEYLARQEKRDVYQVKINIEKSNIDKIWFYAKINVKKGTFPSRRMVAKLYGDVISKNIIRDMELWGSKVEVVFISKLGTFKMKDIKN